MGELRDDNLDSAAGTVLTFSSKKCRALALEEERRRTTKAAHDMAAAPLPPLETFSQVRLFLGTASKEPS